MTLIDLYAKTLEHLRVIAAGESAPAEVTATVRDKYATLYALLNGENLVAWSSTEDIPSWADHPMTMMLAAISAREFGVPEPRYSQLQAEGAVGLPQLSLAERTLRRQLARQYVSSRATAEYF